MFKKWPQNGVCLTHTQQKLNTIENLGNKPLFRVLCANYDGPRITPKLWHTITHFQHILNMIDLWCDTRPRYRVIYALPLSRGTEYHSDYAHGTGLNMRHIYPVIYNNLPGTYSGPWCASYRAHDQPFYMRHIVPVVKKLFLTVKAHIPTYPRENICSFSPCRTFVLFCSRPKKGSFAGKFSKSGIKWRKLFIKWHRVQEILQNGIICGTIYFFPLPILIIAQRNSDVNTQLVYNFVIK